MHTADPMDSQDQSVRYYSKKDAWLILLLSIIFPFAFAYTIIIAIVLRTFSFTTLLGPVIMLAVLVLFAFLTIPLYYEVTSTSLVVRSGLMRWHIPLTSIGRVFPTRNPLSSPALSLDRLQIEYTKNGVPRFILISPKDKSGFLAMLAQRGVNTAL